MRAWIAAVALLLSACAATSAPAPAAPETPMPAIFTQTPHLDQSASLRAQVAAWAAPVAPFTIMGNVHYVGAAGVSSFLITTRDGHFLLDGGVAEMAPRIEANIAALGFNIRDVKYLLSSHAHFDHSGGLAYLQRQSGTTFVASAADKPILESGHIGWGPAAAVDAAPIRVERVIGDGESLTLGGVTMMAHLTPGHTPGCTSWSTMTQGAPLSAPGRERRVFFHCSASVGGQTLVPESYPGMIADYRRMFDQIIPEFSADILLVNHPEMFNFDEKRQKLLAGDGEAFVDDRELQAFNARMRSAFEAELARQQAAAH